jgi:hypothetical protein
LDEPFRNEEICVLHPIEDVEPDDIPELDLAKPGRLARFQLLMDAVRLSLAPGDDRLVSSTRSRIKFEPYQQVPALRALELPRPRLLIADDVGLGKTIEAGLILRELNARRRAARILIVCPASIIEQWQTELASKFGFQFKIFDGEGVAEARLAPTFAATLRAYRSALAEGNVAEAEALLAWVAGQPNVSATAKRRAGIKGDVDHFGALSFLQGLLVMLRDAGYAGLLVVLDEVETLQRVRGDIREKSLNALRQLIDEIGPG